MKPRAAYRRLFSRGGRRVSIERRVANADPMRVEGVRARIREATDEEIAGGIRSTERRVLILAEDVPAGMLPLVTDDAVLVDGLRMTFTQRPDDQTHRDGEMLLAIAGVVSSA
ncbi:hypothetical protein [Aureimonas sp. Leaf324]|uniref:hypothetical protein n=1 Tax=Aureimonas sp. Leaf324 TaxID=1736336 RepID=UPI0006F92645|nr:hypothetical protein [Aureimonas sp. Leaf324]KQQ81945.1 hypothetical protein ASF65_07775 [Aureimonas sp. Leaf324]